MTRALLSRVSPLRLTVTSAPEAQSYLWALSHVALENGDAERDNVPGLPSEDNEASQHYMPVDLHSNGCDAMVGSKQISGAHIVVRDSQRMLYQRPHTGINTILSPEIPALPNGGTMEPLLSFGVEETKLRQRTQFMLESYAMVTRVCQGLLWEG